MVIKVDFDLAMTVLAYNLLRLLALDLPARLPPAHRPHALREAPLHRRRHLPHPGPVHRLAEEETGPARPAGGPPDRRHHSHPLAGQPPGRL